MADRTGSRIDLRRAELGDLDEVARLGFDYLSWAVVRLREEYGVGWPPIEPDEVRDGVRDFMTKGRMLVATRGAEVLGIGGVHELEDGVAEIKRMYVQPVARGERIGSRLLDGLLDEARLVGSGVVRLDTVGFMTDAQRLYRSRGFVERGPYPGSEIPSDLQKYWLFFERPLEAPATG